MSDTPVISPLLMDRDLPLGNTAGDDLRGRVHVKVSNKATELLLVTVEIPNTTFIDTVMSLSSAAQVAKVGASNLANRKYLVLQNLSGGNIYYGTAGVSSSTGFKIANGSGITLPVGPGISIYIIKQNATAGNVIIQEYA